MDSQHISLRDLCCTGLYCCNDPVVFLSCCLVSCCLVVFIPCSHAVFLSSFLHIGLVMLIIYLSQHGARSRIPFCFSGYSRILRALSPDTRSVHRPVRAGAVHRAPGPGGRAPAHHLKPEEMILTGGILCRYTAMASSFRLLGCSPSH